MMVVWFGNIIIPTARGLWNVSANKLRAMLA